MHLHLLQDTLCRPSVRPSHRPSHWPPCPTHTLVGLDKTAFAPLPPKQSRQTLLPPAVPTLLVSCWSKRRSMSTCVGAARGEGGEHGLGGHPFTTHPTNPIWLRKDRGPASQWPDLCCQHPPPCTKYAKAIGSRTQLHIVASETIL